MSLIGKLLNKLFVSAHVIGNEQLQINSEVVYVTEYNRSEHLALLKMTLDHQGSKINQQNTLAPHIYSANTFLDRLESLIEKLEFNSGCDVLIVPVSIVHGHFPNRQSSWWRLLFSEKWGPRGWWNRLVQLLVNGRHTLVQLDKPYSLRELMNKQSSLPSGAASLKIVDLLKEHFSQRKTAIIGPDLSNRKQLVEKILARSDVQLQIKQYSEEKKLSEEQGQRYAREQLSVIATNLSPSFIRVASKLLSWFFTRTYRSVKVRGADNVRQIAKTHQLVFMPCHRSHMDYVLMSWNLHAQGLMLPLIVAGDNLNVPIMGRVLKLGGAIFMRRSFYDDPLYGLLFKSYIKQLHVSGHALEYFIEGGRSRTGRLLPPKGGVLTMTLEASLQESAKPIALIPVWISYDKLVETRSYSEQLSNESKKPESLTGLLSSLKMFKQEIGDAVVSYGEPISLQDHFSKFENLKNKSNYMAQRVMQGINAACYVNESALLATVLLSQRRLRLAKPALVERVNQLSSLLAAMPNAPIGIAKGNVDDWIADAQRRGQLSVSGDDVFLTGEQACEMTFYRNQIHHLTLLVGLFLLVSKRYHKPLVQTIPKLVKAVYPYLAKELYWPWEGAQVNKALKQIRELLVNQQLVLEENKCINVRNTAVSVALMQTTESYLLRYYTVFRLLHEFDDLTVQNLIDETVRLARVLHVEFGFDSPEYTDVKGIGNFVKAMQNQQVLSVREDGVIYASVDASGLMVRSKQILLPHYVTLLEKSLTKH
jgi:glycerol-3-phosphate O-acyltransferase